MCFEVGERGRKCWIPTSQLKTISRAIWPTEETSETEVLANIENMKETVKMCSVQAFARFQRWLDGDKSIFTLIPAHPSQERWAWIKLTEMMHVAEVMDVAQFKVDIVDAIKVFSLSGNGRYPDFNIIGGAEVLIPDEDSKIWTAFANAWLHHHSKANIVNKLYHGLKSGQVRPILSFFLVKQLERMRSASAEAEVLSGDWQT